MRCASSTAASSSICARGTGPDRLQHQVEFARRHRKSQTGNRRTETGRLPGDADVAAAGDLQPGAHAVAFDAGQQGHVAGQHCLQRTPDQALVEVAQLRLVETELRVLGDIAAGAEMAVRTGARRHSARSASAASRSKPQRNWRHMSSDIALKRPGACSVTVATAPRDAKTMSPAMVSCRPDRDTRSQCLTAPARRSRWKWESCPAPAGCGACPAGSGRTDS